MSLICYTQSMSITELNQATWEELKNSAQELPLATKHYPSRGQTEVQKLYATAKGKIFLKKVSARNHQDCQVDPKTGSLAEREFWAYKLAHHIGLNIPELTLLDQNTTLQHWLDIPDAHTFKQNLGPLTLNPLNVFECGLFDWVTGQIDRHDANYLYDYVNGKIILIDSAHCFLKHDGGLPDYLSLFETVHKNQISKKQDSQICESIKTLRLNILVDMIPLKNPEESKSLFLRLDKICKVNTAKELIALYRN